MEIQNIAIPAILIAIAVIWLVAMPTRAKGKTWHYALVGIPTFAFIMMRVLPAGVLRESLAAWLTGGAAAALLMLVAWAQGSIKRNHGFMDIAYPLAPTAIAWAAFLVPTGAATGEISGGGMAPLVLALVSVWAIRLFVQTFGQNRAEERQPYAAWRKAFGAQWRWWSLFQVYGLQGITLWLWAIPLAFAVQADFSLLWAIAGGAVWLAGFALQAVADRQLTRFRADKAKRGAILDTGAWAIVRQPNYLGESMMWWGYFLCALAHPWGWLTVIGPIFATWFMGFGSAGPFKEAHMRRTRGEAWAAYCARTPRFFPVPRPTH